MGRSRIGVIVATHGDLGAHLVQTTELILGHKSELRSFTFAEGDTPRASARKLRTLIKRTDKGRGVIVLVDLFGGTPGSLALSMLEEAAVEVVTGVNLPMALAATQLEPEAGLEEAGQTLVAAGREAIKGAGRLLKG